LAALAIWPQLSQRLLEHPDHGAWCCREQAAITPITQLQEDAPATETAGPDRLGDRSGNGLALGFQLADQSFGVCAIQLGAGSGRSPARRLRTSWGGFDWPSASSQG